MVNNNERCPFCQHHLSECTCKCVDNINHPEHYTSAPMEVIDAIEGLQLSYHESNILKYIARWKHKNGVDDLRKAKWYLDRLINNNTKESE